MNDQGADRAQHEQATGDQRSGRIGPVARVLATAGGLALTLFLVVAVWTDAAPVGSLGLAAEAERPARAARAASTPTKLPFRPWLVTAPAAPVQLPPASANEEAGPALPAATPTKLPFLAPPAEPTATKLPFTLPTAVPTATKRPFAPPQIIR